MRPDALIPEEEREATAWPLYLNSITPHPGQLSVRVTGENASSSDEVILWRRTATGYERVATSVGDSKGRFDFGGVLIPYAGLELVATRSGEDPVLSKELSKLRLEPASFFAPVALLGTSSLSDSAELWRFDVMPARMQGQLVIADGQRQVLGRVDLDPNLHPRGTTVRVEIEPSEFAVQQRCIQIAQELADGRLTSWRTALVEATDSLD